MSEDRKFYKQEERNFQKEDFLKLTKNEIPSGKLLFLKDLNNLQTLERRVKQCRKRIAYSRSFFLSNNICNLPRVFNTSMKKAMKLTKTLEIASLKQNRQFAKIFPSIKTLNIFYSDFIAEEGTVIPFNYQQIIHAFSSNVWKKLQSLNLYIEDQTHIKSVQKLLKSLKKTNSIKDCKVDLAVYIGNYVLNLGSILQFLVNSKNLEILNLKSLDFLSKDFCNSLAKALCKWQKLKALKFMIFDNEQQEYYNTNLVHFIQQIRPLSSLECIEFECFGPVDPLLIAKISQGFKGWTNLKKVALQFDNNLSGVDRNLWVSFFDNLSELDIKVLSLKFLNLSYPIWKIISKAIYLFENLQELFIGFSEGLNLFVKDFYNDLGQALTRYKKLKKLNLVLSFINNSFFEKLSPALQNCRLTQLSIIGSVNSSQPSELESISDFLSKQEQLAELSLDLNFSKQASFLPFNYDSIKRLFSLLTKLPKLTDISLKIGGIEDKFINILKDFENLPPKLVSLKLSLKKKPLNDRELLSLLKGLQKLRHFERFYLNADFGNITEETYALFYKSIFQTMDISNIRIDAGNAILPGLLRIC